MLLVQLREILHLWQYGENRTVPALRGTVKTTLVGTTLSISNVRKQDVGYYIRSAKNSVGSSSDTFSLSVTGRF